jgi:hypothetical protein
LVTANAFWSAAGDGGPTLKPFGATRVFSFSYVARASVDAIGLLVEASLPLICVFQYSATVETYSGTTSISLFTSAFW